MEDKSEVAGLQLHSLLTSCLLDCKIAWLVFGMLYPAYYSYKAVKTKNVKEYVRWMMYWIVFALYTVTETITDLTVSWFPLYYELKIAFVIWLLSPYTRGASLIYRKFLHPLLSSKEREIDEYIVQAKERGYETMVNFGRQGLNLAATAAVTAAVKMACSYFLDYEDRFTLNSKVTIQFSVQAFNIDVHCFFSVCVVLSVTKPHWKKILEMIKTDEEMERTHSEDEMFAQRGLRRTQSMKSVKTIKGRKEIRYGSLKYRVKKRPVVYF
ncbi:receptor expression-enhancing protein 3 [Cyanistes caeruleus]|uniref:receptor expression-enhancing protein 3 n=1 Tax=Cyanistes caeruleus TaxID=156563 RepID=UPI000CDA330C|nr:receptor expression-enhancing protein 3 [Cyanistes caeruleus]